jgi:TetR/AcrR family transcriptional regulator, mexJK operon transcriptional repressor
MQPEVLQLRRLMIGEAGRLPEVARAYYDAAPGRTLATLAASFGRLAERGCSGSTTPSSPPATSRSWSSGCRCTGPCFRGGGDEEQADLHRVAHAGCRAFLSLYRQP